ncbi:MAG: serine/threonine protein kinase [Phycisphaerae bacterium]
MVVQGDNSTPQAMNRQIGSYRLLDFLGRGAQGSVHKAEHTATGQLVALKIIRDGFFSKPSDRELFVRECRTIAKLDHPAIVPIIDDGSPDGIQFFAMPYIEGIELHAWARTRADLRFGFSDRRLPVFLQICDALDHAHVRGIVHRDLKPENIRIDRYDRPFILDFGLASDEQRSSIQETGRGFKGTYFFASPEQIRHESTDQRSDVYTLGVLLYFLLTDAFPFSDATQSEFEWHHLVGTPPRSARRRNARVPRVLDRIVRKALSHRPDDRYQSAAELADDIRRYLAGEATSARGERPHRPLLRFVRRHRGGLLISMALIAIAVLGIRSYMDQRHLASSNPFDLHTETQAAIRDGDWDLFLRHGTTIRRQLANLERSPYPGYVERAAQFRKGLYESLLDASPPPHVLAWLQDDPPLPGFGRVIDANHDLFADEYSNEGRTLWKQIHDEYHLWDTLPPDMIGITQDVRRKEWRDSPAFEEVRMNLPNYEPGMRFVAEVRALRDTVLRMDRSR